VAAVPPFMDDNELYKRDAREGDRGKKERDTERQTERERERERGRERERERVEVGVEGRERIVYRRPPA
jgi:hypothetical protein